MQDIILKDGEIQIGNSDQEHAKDLGLLCKGWHKFNPFIGACLQDEIGNENGLSQLVSALEEEVKQDGGTLTRVDLVNDELYIDAQYNS